MGTVQWVAMASVKPREKLGAQSSTLTIQHEGREYLVVAAPSVEAPLPAVFSPAEAEVVRLVLAGQSNESIAESTGRAERTVSNLLVRACRKVGVRRRTELAAALARYPRGESRG